MIGINLSAQQGTWRQLLDYTKIRNKIIHNRSKIQKNKSDNNEVIQAIKKFDGASISEETGEYLIFKINDLFVTNYISTSNAYLKFLLLSIIKK